MDNQNTGIFLSPPFLCPLRNEVSPAVDSVLLQGQLVKEGPHFSKGDHQQVAHDIEPDTINLYRGGIKRRGAPDCQR